MQMKAIEGMQTVPTYGVVSLDCLAGCVVCEVRHGGSRQRVVVGGIAKPQLSTRGPRSATGSSVEARC